MHSRRSPSQLIAATAVVIGLALCNVCSVCALVEVSPASLSGEEGSRFTFTCSGPSTANLEWYRRFSSGNDTRLVTSSKYEVIGSLSENSSTSTLTIKNAMISDTGNYFCQDASDPVPFVVPLTVSELKDMRIDPSNPQYETDKALYLTCFVNNATDLEVSWHFNGGTGSSPVARGDDASNVQVLNNGTLIIRMMKPENAGIYTCTHAFSGTSKSVSVSVGGDITLTAPRSVKFTEGDRALIECTADVITKALLPNITWLIDSMPYEDNCTDRCSVKVSKKELSITSELEIVKITMDDRKNYTCIASNGASEESRDILLRVRDRLAALWPFLGIVSEVVILIIIIFIHEKCSKGEDFGEDDEDDDDLKKEKKIPDGDNEMNTKSKE
ncbi:neuroplastin-like [Diadema antillarum]|uniref:neuroplastin-like n=1 Tax=Diadema antillarum TaxID=105358 RepID=UPI003A85ED1A